jgi:hypothetical protein
VKVSGGLKKGEMKGGVRRFIGIIQAEPVSEVYPHPVRVRDPVVLKVSRNPCESFHTALDT